MSSPCCLLKQQLLTIIHLLFLKLFADETASHIALKESTVLGMLELSQWFELKHLTDDFSQVKISSFLLCSLWKNTTSSLTSQSCSLLREEIHITSQLACDFLFLVTLPLVISLSLEQRIKFWKSS